MYSKANHRLRFLSQLIRSFWLSSYPVRIVSRFVLLGVIKRNFIVWKRPGNEWKMRGYARNLTSVIQVSCSCMILRVRKTTSLSSCRVHSSPPGGPSGLQVSPIGLNLSRLLGGLCALRFIQCMRSNQSISLCMTKCNCSLWFGIPLRVMICLNEH